MNILALDCAVSKINIAIKFGDKMVSQTYDIGMRQSEILVPAVDDILKKAEISVSDLDCTALTIGPGSFTGLRLGISALKAIELAYNIPIYGISSLKVYSYAYKNLGMPVLCCIDANKDRFYACIFDKNGNTILQDGDYEIQEIIKKLDFDKVLIAGSGANKFFEILQNFSIKFKPFLLKNADNYAACLLEIAEQMYVNNEQPLQDYDGPVYLRASEAELKLGKQLSDDSPREAVHCNEHKVRSEADER